MTRNSQRPAFVLVADLPQKSGRIRSRRRWLACGLFLFLTGLLFTHDLLRNLGNRAEINRRGDIEAVGVLPGPQDPALTEVIADMAPMATARAVAIQALI